MTILKIIALGVLLIFLLLVLSHFFITKKFYTEIEIATEPEEVWEVLTNPASYNDWNTVLIPLTGNMKVGEKLLYELTDDKNQKSKITMKVAELTENKKLRQTGGIPGVITFDHQYILEKTSTGTKLIQDETDRGIYLLFWNSNWIEPSYKKSSENLKKLIENK